MRWSGLETWLVPYADAATRTAQAYGIHPVVTSIRRNWAEQAKLYQDYRNGMRDLPANPPGMSAHQYGVAFDSVVPAKDQALWDAIRAHFGWKLYSNDPVHAEFPNWQAYRDQLRLT